MKIVLILLAAFVIQGEVGGLYGASPAVRYRTMERVACTIVTREMDLSGYYGWAWPSLDALSVAFKMGAGWLSCPLPYRRVYSEADRLKWSFPPGRKRIWVGRRCVLHFSP